MMLPKSERSHPLEVREMNSTLRQQTDDGDLHPLVCEYQSVVQSYPRPLCAHQNDERLTADLVRTCEWTPRAASTLLDLVHSYGAFMLRNAAALAIVLRIEDGDSGF